MDSYWCVSFARGNSGLDTTLQLDLTSDEGRLSSPDLLLMFPPKSGFSERAHYWLVIILAATRTPWLFSTKLLFSLLLPSMVHRDIPPYDQSWHFSLIKINEIPVCSLLQTVKIPSEWWNNHLIYQLLLPVLCSLQICRYHAQVQSRVRENITLASTAGKKSGCRFLS